MHQLVYLLFYFCQLRESIFCTLVESKSHASGKSDVSGVSGNSELSIAYIKVDSLAVNYDFAQEMQDAFVKQQDAFTKRIW